MSNEIWVVPFFGQGHLLPSIELCKHIASRNFKVSLIISSNLSSSIPASFRNHHQLLQVVELSSSPARPPPPPSGPPSEHQGPMQLPPGHHDPQLLKDLENLLSTRPDDPPICAIVDVMMSWSNDVFKRFGVPTVGFLTSGACSAAMEYAMWQADLDGKQSGGEVILLSGLPDEMAITESDLKQRPHGPPGGFGHGPPRMGPPGQDGPPGFGMGPPGQDGPPGVGPHNLRMLGPPKSGEKPRWLLEVEDSIAIMINTCHELEGPFVDYLVERVGKPIWGVGPLLPENYWKSLNSLFSDHQSRSNRQSTVTEDEVTRWLDSKPRNSVLYISFGSEVGPTIEEYAELAKALEASNLPFIWVIQPGSGMNGPPKMLTKSAGSEGYYPHGLEEKVGNRGLLVKGWAPQLLILSHLSTGGFLSHCGWNSTVEAIGRGVPFLAWPIGADQYHNAKLVVKHLKVGCIVTDDFSQSVKNDDIANGIEKLWGVENFKKQAVDLRGKFEHGFPPSSFAALDAFVDFIRTKKF